MIGVFLILVTSFCFAMCIGVVAGMSLILLAIALPVGFLSFMGLVAWAES